MSQAELAKRAGMRASVVSRLECGGRDPQLGTLVRLTRALGTTPAKLVATMGRR